MKKIVFILLFLSIRSMAQVDSLKSTDDILLFQKELNKEYRDRKESPLSPTDFKKFKGHDFFPIDLSFRVTAKLKMVANAPFVAFKTTTSRLDDNRIYAMAEFTLHGKDFSIPVYQARDLLTTEKYKDYLFFPFTDETNGKETYDGGRYIDLRIPQTGDEIVIDFNKSYNPYCAYSAGYSCPIVPKENNLDIAIKAGVRYLRK